MNALALVAVSRLDDGAPQDGDALIADVFDRHCQWAGDRFELALAALDNEHEDDGGEGGSW